jgi:hypothetical protein
MTDTATPTPGNRLDAAIEAAKVAVNDLRQQLAAKAAEVGQEVNAKVDEIQARIDEIQAAAPRRARVRAPQRPPSRAWGGVVVPKWEGARSVDQETRRVRGHQA